MLKIMRFTPQICCTTKLLSETVRKKFTKADVAKRIMKEHKASFGVLLETKREKTKRLKLEKTGAIAKVVPSGDSELALMLRGPDSRLKRLRIDPHHKRPAVASKEDDMLCRFEIKIIRKNSESKARESKTSPSEPAVAADNSPAEIGMNEKSPIAESLAFTEKSSKETEIQYREEKTNSWILPRRENIIKNINKALLCDEEHEKFSVEHSSEIISISPMQHKECSSFPSVTHILNATMSEDAKKILELWMARMIDKLGQKGFDEYKRALMLNGKLLHSVIDSTLRKLPVEVPDNLKSCFNSVKTVLDEVQNVRAIESQVVHQNLGYRGVTDCVASYHGNLCLIDWKKSDKAKHLLSSTYDAPLQIASYIGALNADKNYPFQIKSGLIVVAYTMGNPPTVFTLDQKRLQYYWEQWLERLKKYYTMQNT